MYGGYLDGKDNLQKLQMSNSSMLGEVVDGPVQDQIYTLSSSPLSRFLVVISHPSIDNCQCYVFNIQHFANLFSPWVSEAILTCHSSIWLADQHLENKSRILLLKIKWITYIFKLDKWWYNIHQWHNRSWRKVIRKLHIKKNYF